MLVHHARILSGNGNRGRHRSADFGEISKPQIGKAVPGTVSGAWDHGVVNDHLTVFPVSNASVKMTSWQPRKIARPASWSATYTLAFVEGHTRRRTWCVEPPDLDRRSWRGHVENT